jgi:hypothetical protein
VISPTCPECGGVQTKTLAPGYFRCESVSEIRDDEGFVLRRVVCGHEFQTTTPGNREQQNRLCECGILAIGKCIECGAWLCGEHGELVSNRFLCPTHASEVKADQRREATAKVETTRERAEALRRPYIELLNELLDGYRRFMSAQRDKAFRPHEIYSRRDRKWRKSKGSVSVPHGRGWVAASVGPGSMSVTTYWLTTEGAILRQDEINLSVPEHMEGDPGSVLWRIGPQHITGIASYWQKADDAHRLACVVGQLLKEPKSTPWPAIKSSFDQFEASVSALGDSS